MANPSIPENYDAFREIEKYLNLETSGPRPYIRRLPPNGTVFTPDANGYAVFSDERGGIPGRHPDQYPPQRQTPSEKPRLGMIDRILDRVFAMFDRWSMRI